MANTLIKATIPERKNGKNWGTNITPELKRDCFQAWYDGGSITAATKIINDAGYTTINGNKFQNGQVAVFSRMYIVENWRDPEMRKKFDILRAKHGDLAFEDREYERYVLDHLIMAYKRYPKKLMKILNNNPELKQHEDIWKPEVAQIMWNWH